MFVVGRIIPLQSLKMYHYCLRYVIDNSRISNIIILTTLFIPLNNKELLLCLT